MEFFEIKREVNIIHEKFEQLKSKIDVRTVKSDLTSLLLDIEKEDFWNDSVRASGIMKIKQSKEKILDNITEIDTLLEEINLYITLFEDEEITIEDLIIEFDVLNQKFKEFEIDILLTGEYDDNSILLEIHPGAGGTESQDWASMIYNMYFKYFKKNNYKVKVLDILEADIGLKSILIEVSGYKAYGMLKGENGIHRLVRISPFDSSAKRHTSFCSVSVMPVIEYSNDLDIDDKELRIDYFRSSGAGGQSVNTTDSAVRITHIPTNTVVSCQNERSQIQNKEQAMKILYSKLLELKLQQQQKEQAELMGVQLSNGWGSQKRSYVLHPYKMVKDSQSGYQTSNAEKVLSGEIEDLLYNNLIIGDL